MVIRLNQKNACLYRRFLSEGYSILLLDGKGYEFIQFYNEYVDKIYNYQIPLVKIASKSKVRSSMKIINVKLLKNKAGNPMPKQAIYGTSFKRKFTT